MYASAKDAHSGFETQMRCHQKSKTEVSVAPQKDICPPNFLKKKNMVLFVFTASHTKYHIYGYIILI